MNAASGASTTVATSGDSAMAGDRGRVGRLGGLPEDARSRRDPVVRRTAIAVVAAHALFRLMIGSQAYYMEDDYKLLRSAVNHPWSWDYLLQDYNDHLMPGQFGLVWVLQRIAPMSFTLVSLVLLLLSIVSVWLMWLLVRELIGERWLAVVVLVLFAFTPLPLSAYMWYAAALAFVPMQIALLGMLRWHVRYAESGRATDALIALGFFAFGLAMWHKSLLLLPTVVLFALLWLGQRSGLKGALAGLWRDRRLFVGYGVLAVAEVALVLWRLDPEPVPRPGVSAYVEVAHETVVSGVLPFLLGGPFQQASTNYHGGAIVRWSWVYVLVAAVVVIVSLVRHRAAWKAWTFLGSYWLALVITVTATRYWVWNLLSGRSPRYFPEIGAIASIAVALAFAAPLRRAAPAAAVDRTRRNGSVALVGTVTAVFVVCSVITSWVIADTFPGKVPQQFLRNAKADLERIGDAVLLDEPTELAVLGTEQNRLSTLMAGLPDAPSFDVPTNMLYRVDAAGHIARVRLQPSVTASPGADTGCVHPVQDGGVVSVGLSSELFPWRWIVRLDIRSERDALLDVGTGDVTQRINLRRGTSVWYLVTTAGFDSVELSTVGADTPICVQQVVVGLPV